MHIQPEQQLTISKTYLDQLEEMPLFYTSKKKRGIPIGLVEFDGEMWVVWKQGEDYYRSQVWFMATLGVNTGGLIFKYKYVLCRHIWHTINQVSSLIDIYQDYEDYGYEEYWDRERNYHKHIEYLNPLVIFYQSFVKSLPRIYVI